MTQDREFDVVIFGATGFTGQLVAEYFQQAYASNPDVAFALAGRNRQKLENVRDELGASVPLLVADSDDEQALTTLARKASVIITTVGPYQNYGEKLLAACAENGTGYVDLCGEPAWMHDMIEKYEDKAKASGAAIVFSCGFDSVPFDLGVFALQQHAVNQTGAVIPHVKGRVRQMKGRFSGGTAASLQATMEAAKKDKSVMKILGNPFSLADTDHAHPQPDGSKPYHDDELGTWVAPFIMATINTKNIHRSNYLMHYRYGDTFEYDEMMMTGPGEKGEAMARHVAEDKSMEGDDAPKPGEGPSREERENGMYDLLFTGKAENGNMLSLSVRGDKDPGYGSTSKMLSECALCLCQDVSIEGGFYTPAAAFGEALIERLKHKAGLTFTVEA
ncbi:saccharopine dehydrogenase family protein [Alteromonas halophila]|uniref:Saccharopine dehydrogenase n=1 Tax=Alteromonas halophila TaxID=516698 RepID=A0A918MX28_9ALTE|nr:saccharopine dehydrogenase NADP-binding domain-containing protein [Alteromonas halophila]GGW79530.1 saccharopine dehydrogenase [Alteromonas halophila]